MAKGSEDPRARQLIQKDLFSTERLVCCIAVTKLKDLKRKRHPKYLCVTVTSEKPAICKLHTVSKIEKSEGYKKKNTWDLSEIKSVNCYITSDGQGDGKSTADFDITLDKVYKWRAESVNDKQDIVQVIWKLSKRHLKSMPTFENVGKSFLDVTVLSTDQGAHLPDDDHSSDLLTDLAYQVISSKEEQDLQLLMMDSEFAIRDAHQFADKLTNDLALLDGANIHSIVSSEEHVLELMQLIDEAIKDVIKIEEKLKSYDDAIAVVKEEMERVKDKDDLIKVQEHNTQQLMEQLSHLVTSLDLSHEHQKALKEGDLSKESGIQACTNAALTLQKSMLAGIEPALMNMKAVKEQRERIAIISSTFSDRLCRHLNLLFVHKQNAEKVNTLGGTLRAGELKTQAHAKQHKELMLFSGLMKWLKQSNPAEFLKLQQVYSSSLQKVYEKEIGFFLDSVKQIISVQPGGKHATLSSHHAGSSESIQSIDPRQQHVDKKARQSFDKLIEKMFAELTPLCMEEQKFCVAFFNIQQASPDSADNDKGQDSEIRFLLGDIFSKLETELLRFINDCIKQDTFYSLSLLVHLSHHTRSAASSALFLSKVYGSVLVTVKRHFDDYIKALCKSFEEAKPTKKSRCGIISFVHTFADFAEQSEDIFHNSDRRSDIDKAYKLLTQGLFDGVARIANEHVKTPRNVIMLENYHRIFAVLSSLKITCLEQERKEAKQRYQEHTQAYVQEQLGRPMEKLTLFFEGVDEKLKSGVKAEEVGYLLAFNKQELRKVIKEYPAKEVRKGIEALYRKVEKHLCEEENLLQVVWTSMQKEFINQYNLFVDMIAKCYKDAKITLEFSINDILQMFSDIAQSH